MKKKPEISVIMAVNRNDKFLMKAIDSILNQTFKNFEFLIIVNGDNEILIPKLKKIEAKDERVKVYETKIKQLQFNLNFALNLSKAEIIARMDSDDIAEKTRFQKQYIYLKENNIDLLGTDFYYIDEQDNILEKKTLCVFDNKDIRKKLEYHCTFCHPTIMFRKDIILKKGGYCFGSISEDWDLFLKLKRDKDIKFGILREKLLKYRLHSKQMSNQNRKVVAITISFLYFREIIYTKNLFYMKGVLLYLLFLTPLYKILKYVRNMK